MAMIQTASNKFPRQVQIRIGGEEQIEVIETPVTHVFNTIARVLLVVKSLALLQEGTPPG